MNKLKLFCLPYAGGSAAIFNKWKEFIDDTIEIIPIELAGRGSRIQAPMYTSVSEAVDDIFEIVKEGITDGPYALFGHSMGAMLAYELTTKIATQGLEGPQHIFFSGRAVPHIKMREDKKYHLLDEENFKKQVRKLGGTPPEFFKHPELLELFLPLLRNDFMLAATDYSNREIVPHSCNITVFLGKEEDMTHEQADGWKLHTEGVCSIHYFNGGHFFLNQYAKEMVELMNTTLITQKNTLEKIRLS
ncbi:thioesterase II family protein [Aquimarina spongiae]|uniref:Surfactin synthase thioesterase subunit n=1 Tax=Aquimarina spongiae TaxID=570521 RepID=A0A1M6H122_9FLAO|nr:alpha/beta fold hydrolase [Aquimarina spongiae]SHJ15824.1 Surfactin synthase thioesterase subunit [Aquimarina spongiae]